MCAPTGMSLQASDRSAIRGQARGAMSEKHVSGRPITRRPRAQQVGFLVADERFLHGVEFQFSLQDPGDGCGMAGDVRAPHHVGIGGRRLPGLGKKRGTHLFISALFIPACTQVAFDNSVNCGALALVGGQGPFSLFRLGAQAPAVIYQALREFFTAKPELRGYFSVVAPGRVRQTALGQSSTP